MQHDNRWVLVGTGPAGAEECGESSVWLREIADQLRRLFRNVGELD